MSKTQKDLEAQLSRIYNYVNANGYLIGSDVRFGETVSGKIQAILAAEEDEHWDAACDLAEDLFNYYAEIIREGTIENG